METFQYIGQEAGGGIVIAIVAIILAIALIKIAWSGTLSEDAQRRNYERDREKREG